MKIFQVEDINCFDKPIEAILEKFQDNMIQTVPMEVLKHRNKTERLPKHGYVKKSRMDNKGADKLKANVKVDISI